MKPFLIIVGIILLIVAMFFLIWGQVKVAKGEQGTWCIWPEYLVHGGAALIALVCFFVAWRIGKAEVVPTPESVPGEEEVRE